MPFTLPDVATKTFLDDSTDDPKQARAELAGLVDKFNAVLAELSNADAQYLSATGGILLGNLILKNADGGGRQIQILNEAGIVRTALLLDSDQTSPQKARLRRFSADGATVLGEITFDDTSLVVQIGGNDRLTINATAVTVGGGVPLNVGAVPAEVYSPSNPPPIEGGWETLRDFTVPSGSTDTISIADPTNGLFESGFDYKVQCRGLKRSSGSASNIDVQLGTGTSTISWVTASYDSGNYGVLGSDPGGQLQANSQARITLAPSGGGVGSGSGAGLYGSFEVINPMSSGDRTRMVGDFWQRDQPRAFTWQAVRRTEAADSACRIVLSAGDFAAVRVILQKRPNGDSP